MFQTHCTLYNTEEFVRIHAPEDKVDKILTVADSAVSLCNVPALRTQVYIMACCYPLLLTITDTISELIEPTDNAARIATRIVDAYVLGTGMAKKECDDYTRMMWMLAQGFPVTVKQGFSDDLLKMYDWIRRAALGRTRSVSQ